MRQPPGSITVVGTGLAGLRTVAELRAGGFTGRLTAVGAEDVPPYDRPPLTKELFTRPEPLWLAGEGYGDLADLTDDVLLGHRAVALDADDDGARLALAGPHGPRELSADVVVVATGAAAVVPTGWRGTATVHDAGDAARLRDRLLPGTRLVVVGAGWIGAELATVAAARGVSVTVVEAARAPLSHVLGASVGALVVPWYAAHGVELRVGATVTGVTEGGVVLDSGEYLAADVVVMAVGVRPNTRWLAGALPLTVRGALPVDLAGRVTGGPASVRAVGDSADRLSPRDGLVPGAHWDGALNHPAALAAGLLGASDEDLPDPAPYVFSTQLGHELTVVGTMPAGAEVVLRGDPGAGPWTALYVERAPTDEPRRARTDAPEREWTTLLRGGFTVDRPRDVGPLRRALSASRHPAIDLAAAADPAIPLRRTLSP